MKNDPIFIVGNSRSGTTLMARILKSHPDIYILNETFLFDEIGELEGSLSTLRVDELSQILNRLLTVQEKGYYRKHECKVYPEATKAIIKDFFGSPERDFISFVKAFYRYVAKLHGKNIYGDQTPRHVFSLEWIFRLFPDCRVINMVRDPRAVLLSQKNKWKAAVKLGQPGFEILRTRLNYHPVTISLLWNRSIDASLGAIKKEPEQNSRIRTVIFEQLVDFPEEEIKEICKFLDIDFVPKMLAVNVEMSSNSPDDNRRGINPEIANVWKKRLTRAEKLICETIAGDRLDYFGYEKGVGGANYFLILLWLIVWPIHITLAILMNLNRMGRNPFSFILSRVRGIK